MAANDKTTASEKEAPAAATAETTTASKTEEEVLTQRLKRVDSANNSVKNYTMAGMAVGLVPLPLIDMAALSAIQLKMVHAIAGTYDVPFSKNIAKSIIGSLLGSSVAVTLAIPVASLIKIVPIIGQSSGTISTAMIGAAATYAVGRIFVEHFESGGTFLDFDEEKAKAHFKEMYEEGRAFVSSHKAATS